MECPQNFHRLWWIKTCNLDKVNMSLPLKHVLRCDKAPRSISELKKNFLGFLRGFRRLNIEILWLINFLINFSSRACYKKSKQCINRPITRNIFDANFIIQTNSHCICQPENIFCGNLIDRIFCLPLFVSYELVMVWLLKYLIPVVGETINKFATMKCEMISK